MSETQTLTSDQQKAFEQLVGVIQSDQTKVAAAADDYINCAVSASLTVGTSGAGMQGWITYTANGLKIHFHLDGAPSSYWGLFAGGGALALVGALRPERLGGKVGNFEASGSGSGGVLSLWVDGKPVLTVPVPLLGAGTPWPINWGAKGRVRFDDPTA